MKKTLVTGGAGYIGSVLTQTLLADKREVRAFDCLRSGGEGLLGSWAHPRFRFQLGNLTEKKDREKALQDVDSVIHLAAIVGDPACKKEPELAKQVNLQATCSLIDESIAAGVKNFIFVSTCSNYGISDPSQLATEESALNPISFYSESKVAAERYLLKQKAKDFVPTVLRLATVYGVSPRMRFDLTVNEFARDAALGRKLVVFGELYWRPYVHVYDVAQAALLVLNSPASARDHQVFNVGHSDENYQKLTLCDLLKKDLPNLSVEYVKTGPDPRSYRVSFEKIARVLGYQPTHRVPEGLKEVLRLIHSGALSDPDGSRWRNT